MKFLFISDDCDSLGIQCKIMSEGHQVKTYVKHKQAHDIGEGIIDRVQFYEPHLNWADVIVFDATGQGKTADKLRQQGYLVVGGTEDAEKLEDDRVAGMKMFEEFGLEVPEWYGPFSIDQAISHVKKDPRRWVFKPNGQKDRDLTYVSKNSDDMIDFLKKNKSKLKGTGILQLFIDGHEIAVGTTVCNGRMIEPFQVNWEHKKLYPSNLGVNTGEQGTICFYSDDSAIIEEFRKFEPFFESSEYSTDFDINFMVTEDKAYAMEPTVRFGYPAIFLQADNQDMEFGEYLLSLAEGSLEELPMKSSWICGVVLSAPGYPFQESYEKHGKDRPIEQIEDIGEEHLFFYEVKQQDDKYMTSGESGAILVAVGHADSLEEAIDNCYEFIKEKDFPSWLAYRDDIGEKLMNEELEWFESNKWVTTKTGTKNVHSI